MLTPSNPKVKALVEVFEKEIKMLTNNDAIVVLVFNVPDLPLEYDKIVDVVCKAMNVTKKVIMRKDRHSEFVLPRQLIGFFAKSYGRMNYVSIARKFDVDHTTIISSVRKIKSGLATGNPTIWAAVKKITEQLEQLKSAA